MATMAPLLEAIPDDDGLGLLKGGIIVLANVSRVNSLGVRGLWLFNLGSQHKMLTLRYQVGDQTAVGGMQQDLLVLPRHSGTNPMGSGDTAPVRSSRGLVTVLMRESTAPVHHRLSPFTDQGTPEAD